MKRFYTAVTIQAAPGGFEILLDGKPIKTPSRKNLLAPNVTLANALMQEWAAQTGDIIPDTMPLTQILITALDRVAQERPAIEAGALAYLDTDLLCYRAAHPAPIVERQEALWDPWLDWFDETYGIRLRTSDRLRALSQPEEAEIAVKTVVSKMDTLHFTLFQLVVSLSGSLVLALAFMDGRADAAQVYAALHAEENFKDEIYRAAINGIAPNEEKKRASIRKDLDAAQFFLKSLA